MPISSPGLAISTGAMAQVTTGRLIGNVIDEEGLGLPGVAVTVNSDSLLGGARTEITAVDGGYAFVGLPVVDDDHVLKGVVRRFHLEEALADRTAGEMRQRRGSYKKKDPYFSL